LNVSNLRRIGRAAWVSLQLADELSQLATPRSFDEQGSDHRRTEDVETLQGFVTARLADLTGVGGLKTRARQVARAVTEVAETLRNPTAPQATAPTRPPAFMAGCDLPRIRPGVERC
jgi:hypothetical protein